MTLVPVRNHLAHSLVLASRAATVLPGSLGVQMDSESSPMSSDKLILPSQPYDGRDER